MKPKRILLYASIVSFVNIGIFFQSARAFEFELVEFLGIEATRPGQTRYDFLTVGNMSVNGLLGIRPTFVLSNQVSLESSVGLGFPSILGIFGPSSSIDLPSIVFVDVLHHFHFPGLYPYFSVGSGFWVHYLNSLSGSAPLGITPGSNISFQPTLNIGMGLSFLGGVKVGLTSSLENPFAANQTLHLLLDIDYAFL